MKDMPVDPRLAEWAVHIERLEWPALIVDSEWRLAWVSTHLKEFLDTHDPSDLGYGRHIVEAFVQDTWLRVVHPDSQIQMFTELAPFMLFDLERRGRDPADVVPEQFVPLLATLHKAKPPYVWATSFQFISPDGDPDLPAYRVDLFFIQIHDDAGDLIGWLCLSYMGVRPNLLTLLARGDQEMYERMAALVEPSSRRAAVLFCDLHHSVGLSRQLPSAAYFKLVRRLWTGIDKAVAEETGIVGKHAGDGASAFFLVDDLGSPSKAAAAAVRTARRVHEISEEVFREVLDSDCQMKVGLHWGATLYMGQLVPGGRLDVTALGDEVNEAARIQETAGASETLASKQLLEQLTADDAAALGMDVEKILYRPIADFATASEKAVNDAGTVPVAAL